VTPSGACGCQQYDFYCGCLLRYFQALEEKSHVRLVLENDLSFASCYKNLYSLRLKLRNVGNNTSYVAFVGIYEPLQLYITFLPLMSCLLGFGHHGRCWRSGWFRNYGWLCVTVSLTSTAKAYENISGCYTFDIKRTCCRVICPVSKR